jgi:hypothetical protein
MSGPVVETPLAAVWHQDAPQAQAVSEALSVFTGGIYNNEVRLGEAGQYEPSALSAGLVTHLEETPLVAIVPTILVDQIGVVLPSGGQQRRVIFNITQEPGKEYPHSVLASIDSPPKVVVRFNGTVSGFTCPQYTDPNAEGGSAGGFIAAIHDQGLARGHFNDFQAEVLATFVGCQGMVDGDPSSFHGLVLV